MNQSQSAPSARRVETIIGGGADPVDVEVAVDGDPLPSIDRRADPLDDRLHRLEAERRVGLVGGEERPRLLRRPVAAPDERHGDRFAQPQLVGQGARIGVRVGLSGKWTDGSGHASRLGTVAAEARPPESPKVRENAVGLSRRALRSGRRSK